MYLIDVLKLSPFSRRNNFGHHTVTLSAGIIIRTRLAISQSLGIFFQQDDHLFRGCKVKKLCDSEYHFVICGDYAPLFFPSFVRYVLSLLFVSVLERVRVQEIFGFGEQLEYCVSFKTR